MGSVSLKGPGQCKLTEFVPNHVFGHIDRNKALAVVYVEGVSDKVRCDRRATRPGFDRFLNIVAICGVHLILKGDVDKESFFN